MRRRTTLQALASLLFPLFIGAACADSTLPELPGETGRTGMQIEAAGPSGDYVLPPITVTVPGGSTCDPYTDLNFCEDSGGGLCMTSLGYGSEMSLDCPIGGGGGSGGGGGTVGNSTAYSQGFLAFSACVLGVLGTGYTVEQTGQAFAAWWDAQKDYESVMRTFESVVDPANRHSTSPEMITLWEFRVLYAQDRRDDAWSDVRQSVNATGFALAGAATVCGYAILVGP